MSDFTPGPWLMGRTNEGEGYVLSVRHQAGGTQHAVAAVWDDNGMAIGEGIANARLIAAAPDLLAALQWALAELNGQTRYDEDVTEQQIENCYALAQAAITKTTGGAA